MKRESGFTLLETLIALVLVSLLMLALFGGFRAGVGSWQAADRYIEQHEAPLLLSKLFSRHFSQLTVAGTARFSLRAVWDSDRQGLFYQAGPDVLRYVAPLGQAVGNRLYLIELNTEEQRGGGFWIRMVPYDKHNEQAMLEHLEQEEYQQVSDSIVARFTYFMADEWHETLEAGAQPKLLKVEWSVAGEVWPALTYALQVSGS